jgi:hypothetical protein
MNRKNFRTSFAAALLSLTFAVPALAQTPNATPAPQVQPAPGAPPQQQPPNPWPPQQQPAPGQPYPGWPPPPSGQRAPNGEYVAPLSQYTQPIYIPQSVAMSGPRVIADWHPGEPIPPGYHPSERIRKGELIAGLITFGVPYIYTSLAAAIGDDANTSKADALWVPVLGPFIELGQSHSATLDYLLVIDGLAQALGAGLVIHGITSPRTLLIRNDLAMVTVSPVRLGRDGNGVGLLGRF